jgi:hypothetical protein
MTLLEACARIIEESKKATPRPWKVHGSLIQSVHPIGGVTFSYVDCSPEDVAYIVTTANEAPRIAKALIEAAEFVAWISNCRNAPSLQSLSIPEAVREIEKRAKLFLSFLGEPPAEERP